MKTCCDSWTCTGDHPLRLQAQPSLDPACLRRATIVATLVAMAGCWGTGRPPTYPVTGTVQWKGKPVEGARVVLVPQQPGGQAAAGITDAQGRFRLTTFVEGDGALEGTYRVKVTRYDVRTPTQAEKQAYLSIEDEQKMRFAGDELPTPPARNLLPKQYEDENTSGITHTVPRGPSTLDIVLP
jgi:hypothetical protein